MKEKTAFPKIKGRVLFDEPLSKHTTFRIGGRSRVWAEPSCDDDVKKILEFAGSEKKKTFTIGMGSNVLFGGGGFNGISIHLGGAPYKKIKFVGTRARAGAGIKLGSLVNLACAKGLSGIEGLVGIPGTLGGAIFMNSGYKGNISDVLEEVKIMDKRTGKIEIVKR